MRSRTLLILLGAAVALALLWLISQRVERGREQIASGPIFKGADWATANEIFMDSGADSVRLTKSDGSWVVASAGGYPADTAAVRTIFEKLSLFDRRYRHSTNPSQQKTFEVDDESGTEVLIRGPQGDLAHFRMGKNGPDFRSQYIRPVGSDEVYQIPDYLKSVFDVSRIWRDRTIMSFDREKVARLVFHPADSETYSVEKRADGSYVFSGPDSLPAKPAPIESAVRSLAALRADAFPDATPIAATVGLEPPRQEVEIYLADGGYQAFKVGNEASPGRVYVAADGRDTIYLLTQGRISALIPKLDSVKESPAPATP